jgi:hypothetical protein
MSRASRRNHSHHYAAEPVVCVAEYPVEQQTDRTQIVAAALVAGVLLWVAFCLG